MKAAGAINTLPFTGGGAMLTTVIDEFPPATGDFPPVFLVRRTTPGYFETMGIPMIEGRAVTNDASDRRLGTLIISKSIKDMVLAALASAIPARRAAAIPPVVALRAG